MGAQTAAAHRALRLTAEPSEGLEGAHPAGQEVGAGGTVFGVPQGKGGSDRLGEVHNRTPRYGA